MSEAIDPRELRSLADILALVLDDNTGQSVAAIEAVRRRARNGRVTGGAIKNLVLRLGRGDAPATPGGDRPYARIVELERRLGEALSRLEAERVRGAEQARRHLDAVSARHRSPRGLSGAGLAMAGLVGLVFGAVIGCSGLGAAFSPSAAAMPRGVARTAADTAANTAQDGVQSAIAVHVRPCQDASLDVPVHLVAELDGNGVAYEARVAPDQVARLGDPGFHRAAGDAVRAVLDPRCSTMPVGGLRGRLRVVEFRLR